METNREKEREREVNKLLVPTLNAAYYCSLPKAAYVPRVLRLVVGS